MNRAKGIWGPLPPGYIAGLVALPRREQVTHLYQGDATAPGAPMCLEGWNRDNNTRYVIAPGRPQPDSWGYCRICYRRAMAGLDGVPPRGGWPLGTGPTRFVTGHSDRWGETDP